MSRVIVVMGAGGPAGRAVAGRFAELGDTVIGVDRSGAEGCLAVDLLDRDAVRGLAERVRAEHGRVDGVVHLVGGWRGSKTFAGTSLDDWDLLHDLLIRTLQNVSLEFEPLLRASGNGRFVIVSARAAQKPTQGGAAYAAAKAAAEAWTLSLADALKDTSAAAVVLVVNALVHDEMRAANPDKPYRTFTDVKDLAAAIAGLWDEEPAAVNGRRIDLTP
ncbi:SDR family NAD(P)-dependent oxidoreductase [Microbispora bryophytorum]|uniref:Oxidoreductase n=1 Tax=Microbispora bryophytorum TaxID=1460882 RepID=A0A8H9GYZ4_9ACTN|nr:SDR family NAD(P)-dependent oxidoreductase [Microbispora bryophytorum]MBD3135055.1 SDR family NAD(P)-dependent oxidoreductase [Microbispora bryophytorum]TQS08714.1 SDR family NAD(P)-dependent oxidoreductase [Microbispora bryophytorum]GGO10878.1 oxidoreductase [Microbispora bryophytorum]